MTDDGDIFSRPPERPPMLPPALAPRAFWVRAPRLLAGAYPRDINPAVRARKAAALLEIGVTDVVSLMEEDERDHAGRLFNPYAPALEAAGVRVRRFAIRDVTTPSVQLVTTVLDHVDTVLMNRGIVYVHCWGGRGRTGVIIGCWMVRHGWSAPDNAVADLTQLRSACVDVPIRAPDTRDQVDRVRGWTLNQ